MFLAGVSSVSILHDLDKNTTSYTLEPSLNVLPFARFVNLIRRQRIREALGSEREALLSHLTEHTVSEEPQGSTSVHQVLDTPSTRIDMASRGLCRTENFNHGDMCSSMLELAREGWIHIFYGIL